MSALRMPHPSRNHAQAARVVADAFWVLALGLIAAYAFFVALGAFKPTEVAGVSIAVGVLAVLWMVRAWTESHRKAEGRDPRLASARERRGF